MLAGKHGTVDTCPRSADRTISDLAGGVLGGRSGACERLDERHVALRGYGPGVANLAHHEDALAAVLLDRDAHLRVLEEAVGECFLAVACSTSRSVRPPAFTRPISGKVNVPSALDV